MKHYLPRLVDKLLVDDLEALVQCNIRTQMVWENYYWFKIKQTVLFFFKTRTKSKT